MGPAGDCRGVSTIDDRDAARLWGWVIPPAAVAYFLEPIDVLFSLLGRLLLPRIGLLYPVKFRVAELHIPDEFLDLSVLLGVLRRSFAGYFFREGVCRCLPSFCFCISTGIGRRNKTRRNTQASTTVCDV